MKRKKRLICFLLSCLMVLSLCPMSFAEDANGVTVIASGTCGGEGDGSNLTWTFDSNGLLTISGTGAMADYSYADNKPTPWEAYFTAEHRLKTVIISDGVTSIGNNAFSDCRVVTSISIPDSVTRIGDYAFNRCQSLTSITIPAGVTEMCNLWSCFSLNSITVKEGNPYYKSIGNCLIETSTKTLIAGCNTSVIPTDGSVTKIQSEAFYNLQGLTEIVIPKYITYIGDNAFGECLNIASISVEDGNEYYYSAGNCLIERETKKLILGCKSSAIPPDSDITTIGYCAFTSAQSLAEISIPDSVTRIEDYAFLGCKALSEITIGKGVSYIGLDAFSSCSGLSSITVESGNKRYHSSGNCLIETDKKTLLRGCKTSIIPSDGSVTNIEHSAFYGCRDLQSIVIPEGVTNIGSSAFAYCRKLTSVTLPNSLISIGEYAFSICENLQSVTIPNGVTEISEAAFNYTGIESVCIPNSVTSVDEYAFWGCDDLTNVYYDGTQAQWNSISISDGNDTLTSAIVHIGELPTHLTIATAFPDVAFQQYLSENFDEDGDGVIVAECVKIIDCCGLGIHSIEGIERFKNLTYLDCSENNLTTLESISQNKKLEYLYCLYNELTSLNLSSNTNLLYLHCAYNNLSELDISGNASLWYLNCCNNPLTNLDLSNNPELSRLYCMTTELSALDVSSNPKLVTLNCSANEKLSSLDVTNCSELVALGCHRTQLSTIDVSNNTELRSLVCPLNNKLEKVLLANTQTFVDGSDCSANFQVLCNGEKLQGVSGTVCANAPQDGLRIEIYDSQDNYLCEAFTVTGKYQMWNVPSTADKMVFSGNCGNEKSDHVPYACQYADGKKVVLSLRGDITGVIEGVCDIVDIQDLQALYEHLCGDTPLADDYALAVADVNGDSSVNILDYQALYEMVKLGQDTK